MKVQKRNDLYGLVLAGGQSTRMGTDKSQLSFHGTPQKDYLFRVLENFCIKVYTSVGKESKDDSILNPIPDYYSFSGPLNGILSAFKKHPEVGWLTVPVDMPLVDEETIYFLIDNRDANKTATCFYDSGGNDPEPLLTIWEPRAHKRLLDFQNEGNLSPRKFLKSSEIQLCGVPDENALLNINTPEGFAAFLQMRGNSNIK